MKKRIAVLFVAAVVIFPLPGKSAQQPQASNTAPLPADAASKEQLSETDAKHDNVHREQQGDDAIPR